MQNIIKKIELILEYIELPKKAFEKILEVKFELEKFNLGEVKKEVEKCVEVATEEKREFRFLRLYPEKLIQDHPDKFFIEEELSKAGKKYFNITLKNSEDQFLKLKIFDESRSEDSIENLYYEWFNNILPASKGTPIKGTRAVQTGWVYKVIEDYFNWALPYIKYELKG